MRIFILFASFYVICAQWSGQQNGADIRVTPYKFGIWRFQVQNGGYEVKDVIVAGPVKSTVVSEGDSQRLMHQATEGIVKESSLVVNHPNVEFSVDGQPTISAKVKASEGNGVGMEVKFLGARTLYGLPERAIDLALKDGHSYRSWNLDIFKYAIDNDQGLYGTVPLLVAHSPTRSFGFFYLHAGDTTVSPSTIENGRQADWESKAGSLDVFFLPGPTPADVTRQMAHLTGKPALPPLFALGYHQCRWNYRSEDDTLAVDEGFDTHDIPYDVIWLDIEHTDGKRYFTWDQHNFPSPEAMQTKLAAKGRKLVTITDPHIKRAAGYHVFDEASAKGYFIKNSAGDADFEGHCWPGTSSWLDFTNPKVRDWYSTMFKYDKYKGSTPILYIWIDMNEPSVFNAHEVTMDIEAQHYGGVKHRDVHNQYGFYQTMATYSGLVLRSEGPPHDTTTRPFILSRSFFAGTQRYAAIWTGDNEAEWSHLQKSLPMLLTLSISCITFVGADVGGFFGNPDEELLVRWYQSAAFQPFFRGHAHLETKRREPWLFGEANTRLIRHAIQSRYRIMPFLYTVFYEASQEGLPVMRPLFFQWPSDERLLELQDQFMVGDALLIKPVVHPKSELGSSMEVYLPGEGPWYSFWTGAVAAMPTAQVSVEISSIPAFQRGGTIMPLRERSRRSTTAMRNDPYTLQIAVDKDRHASGSLYLDDTHSFKFQKGGFSHRTFELKNGQLSCFEAKSTTPYSETIPNRSEQFSSNAWIERIRVFGWPTAPKEIVLEYKQTDGQGLDGLAGVDASDVQPRQQITFQYTDGVLTLRKPVSYVTQDWTISIN